MPHYEADDENDGASLTDTTQKEVIQWLFFGGALAGLCGACLSLLAYACFPRTRTRQHFAIVNIALSDLVACAAYLSGELGAHHATVYAGGAPLCVGKALASTLGSLASAAWTTVVAHSLRRIVRGNDERPISRAASVAFGWGLPAALCAPGLALGLVGAESGIFCGVDVNRGQWWALITIALTIYIPIWLGLLYNAFALYQVSEYLRCTLRLAESLAGDPAGAVNAESSQRGSEHAAAIRRRLVELRLYPMGLLFIWCPPTALMVSEQIVARPESPINVCLLGAAALTVNLQGLLNAIA